MQDTTQCQTPARIPAADSTTSLLCLSTQVRRGQEAFEVFHVSFGSDLSPPFPSGLLLHPRGGITGKRERESEREGSGEEEPASCSVHKMQRQSAEVSPPLGRASVQKLPKQS